MRVVGAHRRGAGLAPCLLRFICSSPIVRSPGTCSRASITFTPGRVPTRIPARPRRRRTSWMSVHRLKLDRRAVGRAACRWLGRLRSSLRSEAALAAVVEVEHRHAGGEGAEERLVAVAVAADDLHLPAARLHVLGEVERGADRAAHVPGGPQEDRQAPLAVLARLGADRAQQHAAHGAHEEALDPAEDGRPRYNLHRSIVTARGLEEDAERRADPRDGLPAAARGRRSGQAAARRRPPDRGARVRDLHAALGLDAAARAARQPLADPLAARAAPALRLRALRPEVVGALDEGAGPRHPRRRLPAVGPPAAPRAHRQPQVDHRRQDAQQRLHRRPPARGVAGRALHLPAPPPGRDRALAAEVQRRGRATS